MIKNQTDAQGADAPGADVPPKSAKTVVRRKLTAKQLMKAKRLKEMDAKKSSKQKENEIRASYYALGKCKTTLDAEEREPTVGDKLIVRDEYEIKYEA
jgi:hypothetical protein